MSILNCGSESKRMDNNMLPLIQPDYYRKRERERWKARDKNESAVPDICTAKGCNGFPWKALLQC